MEKSNLLKLSNPEPLEEIDSIAAEYQESSLAIANRFSQLALTANAIGELRKRLPDDLVRKFKSVENTRLGFMTDKRDKGYPIEIIRDCLIEAALRGLQVVGNEINIIAGNLYVTKEGFQGLMKRDRRFQDVRIDMEIPQWEKTRAIVAYRAAWMFDGVTDSLEGKVPVRVDGYSSDDQVLGKAERKIRCRIWNRATGSNISDGDADERQPDVGRMRNVTGDVRTVSEIMADKRAQDSKDEKREAAELTESHEQLLSLMRRDKVSPGQVLAYATKGGFCDKDAKIIEDIPAVEAAKFVSGWANIVGLLKMKGGK